MQLASIPAPSFTGNGFLCMVRGPRKDSPRQLYQRNQTEDSNSSTLCRHVTHDSNDLQRLRLLDPFVCMLAHVLTRKIFLLFCKAAATPLC